MSADPALLVRYLCFRHAEVWELRLDQMMVLRSRCVRPKMKGIDPHPPGAFDWRSLILDMALTDDEAEWVEKVAEYTWEGYLFAVKKGMDLREGIIGMQGGDTRESLLEYLGRLEPPESEQLARHILEWVAEREAFLALPPWKSTERHRPEGAPHPDCVRRISFHEVDIAKRKHPPVGPWLEAWEALKASSRPGDELWVLGRVLGPLCGYGGYMLFRDGVEIGFIQTWVS